MQFKELENEIKEKKLSGIYYIYGDETYDINRYKERIIKNYLQRPTLGINYFIIDKSEVEKLKDICEEVTFFGSKKLVHIKNTNLKFNIEYLTGVANKELLIIITEESVDKRTKEYKELSKTAKCLECKKLKEKEAAFFVKQTLNAYKIDISDELASYVIAICTVDKNILINEMKKIVAYMNNESKLTKEIIDNVCIKTLDAKVFDLLDLIFSEDKRLLIEKLDELLEQKTYIGVVSIMIFKQIKQIYMIKLLNEKAKNEGLQIDVSRELGIHPFVYAKLKYIVPKFTKKALEELLIEFATYDKNVKVGKIDAIIGLKNILIKI